MHEVKRFDNVGACINHRECSSASLRCFRPCGQSLLAAAHADAVVDSALSPRLHRFAKSPDTRQESASRHPSPKPLTGQPASFWAVGWCLAAMALGMYKGNNDGAWRSSPTLMGTQVVARAYALVRVAVANAYRVQQRAALRYTKTGTGLARIAGPTFMSTRMWVCACAHSPCACRVAFCERMHVGAALNIMMDANRWTLLMVTDGPCPCTARITQCSRYISDI